MFLMFVISHFRYGFRMQAFFSSVQAKALSRINIGLLLTVIGIGSLVGRVLMSFYLCCSELFKSTSGWAVNVCIKCISVYILGVAKYSAWVQRLCCRVLGGVWNIINQVRNPCLSYRRSTLEKEHGENTIIVDSIILSVIMLV